MLRSLSLVLVLAACSQLPIDQQVAVACKGYATTLSSITPFKSQMNASQVALVDQANTIVIPACESAAAGGDAGEDVLRVINSKLREMTLLERQVKS